MRDLDAFENLDLSRMRPLRPTSAALALLVMGALALLAAGVLFGVYTAGV